MYRRLLFLLSVCAVISFSLSLAGTFARAASDDAIPPSEAPKGSDKPKQPAAPPKRKVDPERRKKWEAERAEFKKRLSAWKNAKKYRGCRFQKPQNFLIRSNFLKNNQIQPALHQRAVKYRAEKYGFIQGFNLEQYHPASIGEQITSMRFMGLPIQVHERLEPAFICVENMIKKSCTKEGEKYTPKGIGGLRVSNTYRGGEISNHLFGIAMDIDTGRNPCCGCVAPWRDHPLCKKPVKSVYERTALTKCWVNSFEKYGFYWLGHDKLEDTMHFEFLGDPDRILPR